MPVEPNPQPIEAWPRQINVPFPGLSITIQVQGDGSGTVTPQETDEMLQDLIDYLQEWPDKMAGADVTGGRYDTLLYLISPTNPVPPPPPPEPEPENDIQAQEV